LDGGDHVTLTRPFPAVALTLLTGPGLLIGATGVTARLGPDAAPLPATLVAVTVNV
jgi:hypothetical protein